MMTTATWTTGSGLVTFNLKISQQGSPADQLAHATSVVLEHAHTVGDLTYASLSTLSEGEDAIEWNAGELDPEAIIRAVQVHADAARVELSFDLRCRGADDAEFVIARGMDCWIERGSLVDPAATDPLEITIALDTDVYSPVTWGEDRDNRLLAARNAPLFNQFLLAVRHGTGAAPGPIHAEDYAGHVGPDGFKV
jgi:hypothetical protein